MTTVKKTIRCAAAMAPLILGGCVALGWRFGPGFSSRDTALFAQPPVVEHRGEDYFLTWTQGSYPYYFLPECRAMDERLICALQATTSTASAARRHFEIKIEGAGNHQALRQGEVYWWEPEPEPGRSRVPLTIIERAPTAGAQ